MGHRWVRWLVDQRRVRVAWAVWAIVFLVFTAVTIAKPDFRSVTVAYRTASENWLAGRDIYPQREGEMNYLPQFAILFSPFAQLPKAAGDTLWRLLQMGVFVSAFAGSPRWPSRVGRISSCSCPSWRRPVHSVLS